VGCWTRLGIELYNQPEMSRAVQRFSPSWLDGPNHVAGQARFANSAQGDPRAGQTAGASGWPVSLVRESAACRAPVPGGPCPWRFRCSIGSADPDHGLRPPARHVRPRLGALPARAVWPVAFHQSCLPRASSATAPLPLNAHRPIGDHPVRRRTRPTRLPALLMERDRRALIARPASPSNPAAAHQPGRSPVVELGCPHILDYRLAGIRGGWWPPQDLLPGPSFFGFVLMGDLTGGPCPLGVGVRSGAKIISALELKAAVTDDLRALDVWAAGPWPAPDSKWRWMADQTRTRPVTRLHHALRP